MVFFDDGFNRKPQFYVYDQANQRVVLHSPAFSDTRTIITGGGANLNVSHLRFAATNAAYIDTSLGGSGVLTVRTIEGPRDDQNITS